MALTREGRWLAVLALLAGAAACQRRQAAQPAVGAPPGIAWLADDQIAAASIVVEPVAERSVGAACGRSAGSSATILFFLFFLLFFVVTASALQLRFLAAALSLH